MKRFFRTGLAVAAFLFAALPAIAQTAPSAQDVPRLTVLLEALSHLPPDQAAVAIKTLSPQDIDGMLWLVKSRSSAPSYPRYSQPAPFPSPYVRSPRQQRAVITTNPYLSTPISQYDHRVNAYSPNGANNPYTTQGGKVYGVDGRYLGKLNSNKYDPESVANPYGKYGSPYSSTSINNPYSAYGSPYSSKSAKNPYTTTPPIVIYGDTTKK